MVIDTERDPVAMKSSAKWKYFVTGLASKVVSQPSGHVLVDRAFQAEGRGLCIEILSATGRA